MTVAGLDALMRSLRQWMADTGRPVRYETVQDAEIPAVLISLWATSQPDVRSLSETVARRVGVTITSVGRNAVDAQWLDAKVTALLMGPLPTGLEVEIVDIVAEAAAALEPGEGRMLAVHRVALAYR